MRIFAGLAVALFTIVAPGFWVTTLLVRRRLTIAEHLALAWLFGTAVTSLTLWMGGFVLRGLLLQAAMTTFCVVCGALGFRRWRELPSQGPTEAWKTADIVFMVLFALESIAMFWISFQQTLGWDGLTIWELKARYAFLNGGALPSAYFSDVSRWFSHPEYPLLLPLTETWFYTWIGNCDQFWIKLIFPIWYVAAMPIMLRAGEELSGRRWVGRMLVLVFPLLPCLHNAPGGFESGYADAPLAVIYVSAVFYLLRYMRDRSSESLALCIALASTLPWMKREGAILWGAISICSALSILRQRTRLWLVALSFLPGLCIIIAWKIFLGALHALPPRDFVAMRLDVLHSNLHHTMGILREVSKRMIQWHHWNIFWPMVALAGLCLLWRRRSRGVGVLFWLLLAPLSGYCASYVFSAWPDYTQHIRTSATRLLIQISPIGWLLIALALARESTQEKLEPMAQRVGAGLEAEPSS